MDIKEQQPETTEEQRVAVEAQSNGQPQETDQQQDQQQHTRYDIAYANLTPPNQTVVVDPVSLIFP